MAPTTSLTAGLPEPDALTRCQADRKHFQVSFAISLTIALLSFIPLLVFAVKHSRASRRASEFREKYDAVKLSLEQCASERVFFSNLVDRLQAKLDSVKEERDPHGRTDQAKVRDHTEIAKKPFHEYVKHRPGGLPPSPMEIDKHGSSSSISKSNPFVVGSDTDSDSDGETVNYTSPVVYTNEAQLGRVRRQHYNNRRPSSVGTAGTTGSSVRNTTRPSSLNTAASSSPIRPLIMTPGSSTSPLASSYGSSGKQKQEKYNSPGGGPRLGFSQLEESADPAAEARMKKFLTPVHERARSSRMSVVVAEPSPLSQVTLRAAPFQGEDTSTAAEADVDSATATGPMYLRTNKYALTARQQVDDFFYEATAASPTADGKKEEQDDTLAEAHAAGQREAEAEFGTFSGVHAPTPGGRRMVVTPVTSGEEEDEEEEFPIREGADYARQGLGRGSD